MAEVMVSLSEESISLSVDERGAVRSNAWNEVRDDVERGCVKVGKGFVVESWCA